MNWQQYHEFKDSDFYESLPLWQFQTLTYCNLTSHKYCFCYFDGICQAFVCKALFCRPSTQNIQLFGCPCAFHITLCTDSCFLNTNMNRNQYRAMSFLWKNTAAFPFWHIQRWNGFPGHDFRLPLWCKWDFLGCSKKLVTNYESTLRNIPNIYINIRWCVSQTQQNFIVFIIVLGQHVSILIESSSGPSKKIDPYLKCLKMHYGITNVSVWDPTVHF